MMLVLVDAVVNTTITVTAKVFPGFFRGFWEYSLCSTELGAVFRGLWRVGAFLTRPQPNAAGYIPDWSQCHLTFVIHGGFFSPT